MPAVWPFRVAPTEAPVGVNTGARALIEPTAQIERTGEKRDQAEMLRINGEMLRTRDGGAAE